MHARARACVRVCMRACVRVCMRYGVCYCRFALLVEMGCTDLGNLGINIKANTMQDHNYIGS